MVQQLVVLACLLAGAPTPSEDLQREVQRLIVQLDAPRLAVREEAEAKLLGHGTVVLDLLPPANGRMPAETQQRLGRVRQKLEQQAAESAVEPSRITLRGEAVPLSVILTTLERQSGNPIFDARGKPAQAAAEPKLSVSFDRVPFWAALDRVLHETHRLGATNLTLDLFSQAHTIRIVAAPGDSNKANFGTADYSGPFRFCTVGASARRGALLVVPLQVAWEPRVQVIMLAQRMADIVARDQHGKPLPLSNPESQLEIPVSATASAVRYDVPLDLSGRSAPPQSVRLQGKLMATVAGKRETFRFGNLASTDNVAFKNVEQRIASATVTLEQGRKTDDTWEVRMRVRFDEAGDALASHRTWIFNNPAYLETVDGRQIPYKTFETLRQEKNEVGIAFFFDTDQPLESLTFVYKTPGAILHREFHYELNAATLPN